MSIEVKQMLIKSNISEQSSEQEVEQNPAVDSEQIQAQMSKTLQRSFQRLMTEKRER